VSVEYYLLCEKHKQYVHACSDGFSGPLLQCDKSLAYFVITHRGCAITIINEHVEEDLVEYIRVTNQNKDSLFSYENNT
jgi:hypothetical protein